MQGHAYSTAFDDVPPNPELLQFFTREQLSSILRLEDRQRSYPQSAGSIFELTA